jgi:hypothetical protein
MNGYLERPDQIKLLVENETGYQIESWELAHLLMDDLNAFSQPVINAWYYGTFVIQSLDPNGTFVTIGVNLLGGAQDTFVIQTGGNGPNVADSAKHDNVMWSYITEIFGASMHFYGWKFNRARGYVAQSKSITPALGWMNVGTVYTHTSGVLELSASGAWAASSDLRITITVSGMTAGTLTLEFYSGVVGTITENGTYTFSYTTDGLDSALYMTPTGTFNGSVDTDNLIIKKLDYI